jgi:hypothetical protein
MFRLPLATATLVLCTGFCAAAQPTAVLAVKSVDGLLADARFVTSMFGDGKLGKQATAFLKQIAAAKDHLGVDPRRPFGVYFTWPAGWIRQEFPPFPFVGFVPVSDEKRVRATLRGFNCKIEKEKDGLYRVTVPGSVAFFLRFAGGHGYVSAGRAALRGEWPPPASFLPPLPPERVLAGGLRIDRIPAVDKEFVVNSFIKPIIQTAYGGPKKRPGESPTQARLRTAAGKQYLQFLAGPIEGSKEVTFHLDLDPKRRRLELDLTWWPQPKSAFAGLLRDLSSGRSVFTGLPRGAQLRLVSYYRALDAVQRYQASQGGLRMFGFTGWQNMVDPYRRPLVRRALRALTMAEQVDANDLALAFQVHPGGWSWVGGAKLGSGRKLENLVREFVKDLPAADRELYRVRWNHIRIGNTRIHQAGIPLKVSALDNEGAVYFAIREDVAIASVGIGGEADSSAAGDSPGLAAIHQALAGLNKLPAPAPLFEAEGSVPWAILMGFFFATAKENAAAWRPIVCSGKPPDLKAIKRVGNPALVRLLGAFQNEDWDRIRARVTLSRGDAVRLRVVVDTRIFQLVPVLQEMSGGR